MDSPDSNLLHSPSVEPSGNVVRPNFGRGQDSIAQNEIIDIVTPNVEVESHVQLEIVPAVELPLTAVPLAADAAEPQTITIAPSVKAAALRPKWWLIAAGIVSALAILPMIFSGPHTAGTPSVSVQTLYVTRGDAVVRSAATIQNSEIITTLVRGTPVIGVWETQTTGSKWLRLSQGSFAGDFIWGKNLSATTPPTMTQAVNAYMKVTQLAQLRETPSLSANIVEVVRPGLRIFIAGEVEGGWMEIPLKHGGIGYLPSYVLQ